jgi:hypothetical protein
MQLLGGEPMIPLTSTLFALAQDLNFVQETALGDSVVHIVDIANVDTTKVERHIVDTRNVVDIVDMVDTRHERSKCAQTVLHRGSRDASATLIP